MRHGILTHNETNAEGVPTGGTVVGTGITIVWQRGALGRGGEKQPPNGAFVEDVIDAAKQRLEYFQSSGFACPENAHAIACLESALAALDERTRRREARQVEGTHTP